MATKTGEKKAASKQAANALPQPQADTVTVEAPAAPGRHLDAPSAAVHPAAGQSSGVTHSQAKAVRS